MGKCLNPGGNVRENGGMEGGENFEEKNANVTNAIQKWIYVASFTQIGQWESVQNRGKKLGMDRLTDVENQRYILQTPSLRLHNFFSKRNFDTGFEISFVGTMDIS